MVGDTHLKLRSKSRNLALGYGSREDMYNDGRVQLDVQGTTRSRSGNQVLGLLSTKRGHNAHVTLG